jgi:hypothetical protein
MMTRFTFMDEQNSDYRKSQNLFFKLGENIWRKTATFIYEMPVSAIAMLVAGVVSLIFFPMFTATCFGAVSGIIMSRIVVKFIDKQDIRYLAEVKSKAVELNKTYPNITVIAFIFSTIVGLFSSSAALVFAAGLGIFKGIIIQVDIYNYNRNLRMNNL